MVLRLTFQNENFEYRYLLKRCIFLQILFIENLYNYLTSMFFHSQSHVAYKPIAPAHQQWYVSLPQVGSQF